MSREETASRGGEAPKAQDQAGQAGTGGGAPALPDPPERHQQDTRPVEGDDILNPPHEADLVQRSRAQG